MNELLAMLIQLIRIPVAIGVVGYLPGVALVYSLFPRRRLNRVEHFYVSTLASLCLSTLTAYALARLDGGMTPQRLLFWLAALTLLFFTLAGLRTAMGRLQRLKLHADWWQAAFSKLRRLPVISLSEIGLSLHQVQAAVRSTLSKTIYRHRQSVSKPRVAGALLPVVLALGVLAAYNDPDGYGLTELYLLPTTYEQATIEYVQIDDSLILQVGVVNREDRAVSYQFEVVLDEQSLMLPDRLTLQDGKAWQGNLAVPLPVDKTIRRVDVLLHDVSDAPEEEPVARLRLWLQDESTQKTEKVEIYP